MATIGALVGYALIGTAVAAAVQIPATIIANNQAQAMANYQSAVAMAQADYQDRVAQLEAKEIARSAKFTFGEQRATAAAMGLGMVGTSAGDIQNMDIGLATLDVQKKLYEGDVALWQGEVTSQIAQYEADVAKYSNWVGAGTSMLKGAVSGAMGGAMSVASGMTGSGFWGQLGTGLSLRGWSYGASSAVSGGLSSGGISSRRSSVLRGDI